MANPTWKVVKEMPKARGRNPGWVSEFMKAVVAANGKPLELRAGRDYDIRSQLLRWAKLNGMRGMFDTSKKGSVYWVRLREKARGA